MPSPPRTRTLPVALVVLLVVAALALSGCIGGDPAGDDDAGPAADDDGTTGGTGDGGTGGASGDGDDGGDGSTGNDSGSGDGGSGGGDADDAGPTYRTPSDAMPGHEPVEDGEGFAHFRIEGTADFALNALFSSFNASSEFFNLSLQGDETLIEVVLTWDGADAPDQNDLNLFVVNHRRTTVSSGSHGQVFLNQVCEELPPFNECIFVFPPNGTTWEYAPVQGEPLDAVEGPEDGDWFIEISEENNWSPQAVQGYAGLADGIPYVLDVWVYTLPGQEKTHHPAPQG